MATATLSDGRKIQFPDGLPPDRVKMIIQKASGSAVAPKVDNEQPKTPGILKSIGSGLVKGAAAIPGAIGDIPALIDKGAAYAVGQTLGRMDNYLKKGTFDAVPASEIQEAETKIRKTLSNDGMPVVPKPQEVITTEKVLGWLKGLGVELPEAVTKGEKYAETISSFGPSAIAGGGTLKQKLLQTLIPGASTEAVGQELEGTDYEGIGRLLTAIITGVGTNVLTRRDIPEKMVADAAGNLTDQQLQAAKKLMADAELEGVPLTIPEAIQQVTGGGTRLADLQRVVEQTPKGGQTMRDFYAPRAEEVKRAGARKMDQMAPAPLFPEVLGPRVNTAAKKDIEGVNTEINNRTRSLYQKSANDIVNSPALASPAYKEGVKSVRADPVLGPKYSQYPDNSVAMVDAVQKILKSQAEALNTPGVGLNRYKSSVIELDRKAVKKDARQQSSGYDAALNEQRRLREGALNPLKEGPTGKLAKTTDVGKQTQSTFPSRPQAGSERGTGRAIRGVGKSDPKAAEGIVRQHLETVFAESTQKNMGGANQAGGAKFAATIAGNPQQRKNLMIAVQSLPNGVQRWHGLNRFLRVLEATGQRQAPGSATAFNAQIMKELEGGKFGGELPTLVASPQRALTVISDKYKQYRLGKGSDELARLFTRGSIDDFKALLNSPVGSPKAAAAAIRLLGQISVSDEAVKLPNGSLDIGTVYASPPN
jgi:hypothetical protein